MRTDCLNVEDAHGCHYGRPDTTLAFKVEGTANDMREALIAVRALRMSLVIAAPHKSAIKTLRIVSKE